MFIEVLNSDGLTELEVSSCLLELFLDESEEGGLLKEFCAEGEWVSIVVVNCNVV